MLHYTTSDIVGDVTFFISWRHWYEVFKRQAFTAPSPLYGRKGLWQMIMTSFSYGWTCWNFVKFKLTYPTFHQWFSVDSTIRGVWHLIKWTEIELRINIMFKNKKQSKNNMVKSLLLRKGNTFYWLFQIVLFICLFTYTVKVGEI